MAEKRTEILHVARPILLREGMRIDAEGALLIRFHTTLRKLLPEYLRVITNKYGRRYFPFATRVGAPSPKSTWDSSPGNASSTSKRSCSRALSMPTKRLTEL
jgi:hypothetical protein